MSVNSNVNQPLFLQKTKPLSPNPKSICEWGLNLGRKELGIWSSCVRSPWGSKNIVMIFTKTVHNESFVEFSSGFELNSLRCSCHYFQFHEIKNVFLKNTVPHCIVETTGKELKLKFHSFWDI